MSINLNLDQLFAGAFGLSTLLIVYWLIQKARQVGVITSKKVAFFAPGVIWSVLIGTYLFSAKAGMVLLFILGGWVGTMLVKAGAKDGERDQQPPTA